MDSQRKGFSWATHWLSVFCVIAPIVLGFGAPQFATQEILARYRDSIIKDGDKYYHLLTDEPSAQHAGAEAKTSPREKSDASKRVEPQVDEADLPLLLAARDVKGRVGYMVASAFLWVISIGVFVYGFQFVSRRQGRRAAVIWTISLGALAAVMARNALAVEKLRSFVFENVLQAVALRNGCGVTCDTGQFFEFAKGIFAEAKGAGGWGLVFTRIDTWVAFLAVGMLLASLWSISELRIHGAAGMQAHRWSEQQREDAAKHLKARLASLRVILALGAAVLVCSVACNKMLIDWTMGLLSTSSRAALAPVADALSLLFGGSCTLAMISAIAPAFFAIYLDHLALNAAEPELIEENKVTAPASKFLDFALAPSLGGLLGVFAPILTPQMLELLKAFFGLLSSGAHAG